MVPFSAGMNLEMLISLPKSVQIVHVLWIQVYLGEYLKYRKHYITQKQNKCNVTPNLVVAKIATRIKAGIFGQTAKFGQRPCLFHISNIVIKINEPSKQ